MYKGIRRSKRSIYPTRFRYGKLGVTGLFSVVALLLIVAVGWMLDLRGARSDVREFGEYVRARKSDPVALVADAARGRRFIFLADIYGSAETKRLAGSVVEAIANAPGLDAVVVEVGSDQQPYLDRYFDRSPEDASVLLSQPRTLREAGAGGRQFLEFYHRIWQVNKALGADRRIRVIAADQQGWPPARALSTADRARRFGERGVAMMDNLEREVLNLAPRSRVLVFMSGLQGLKQGTGQLQTGGTAPVSAQWFAALLEKRFPGEVHSVIVDATGSINPDDLVSFRGTRLPIEGESVLPSGNYALPVTQAFDFLSRPIRTGTTPGVTFDLVPRQLRLTNMVDAWVHLGQ